MILGIGTDIIEIARIENAVKNTPSFSSKIFTENERTYFAKKNFKPETIAGFFAAKEAVSKAFGTGFRTFSPQDIEVIPNDLGRPEVVLHNDAKSLAAKLGADFVHLTISHCRSYAVAYAVVEGSR